MMFFRIVMYAVWLTFSWTNLLMMATADPHALVLIRKEDSNTSTQYEYELAKPISKEETDENNQPLHITYPFGKKVDLYIACPANKFVDIENSLYVKQTTTEEKRTVKNLQCKFPVLTTIQELVGHIEHENFDYRHFRVGFKIREDLPTDNSTRFQDYKFINVVDILFDMTTLSLRSVSYDFIKAPTFLSDESTVKPKIKTWYWDLLIFPDRIVEFSYGLFNGEHENRKFETRSLVSLYDFHVQNWREVAEHYAVTAPMDKVLVNDWMILEEFVNDVASLLDNVHIETGTGYTNKNYAYLYDAQKKIRIPDFFWKAVTNYSPGNYFLGQGVLLIMHNLPDNDYITDVCTNISADNQWPPDYLVEKFSKHARIYSCALNLHLVNGIELPFESKHPNSAGFPLKQAFVMNEVGDTVQLNIYDELKNKNYQ